MFALHVTCTLRIMSILSVVIVPRINGLNHSISFYRLRNVPHQIFDTSYSIIYYGYASHKHLLCRCHYHPNYQAVLDQTKIVWNHLLSGRLAYSWSSIISDHLVADKVCDKEMTPLVWGRCVLKQIFQLFLSL